MSWQSWINYGYGISMDEIGEVTVERLQALMAKAPKFAESMKEAIEEEELEDITVNDILEIAEEMDMLYGLASVLKEVIEEVEGVELCACNDYDGQAFILFPSLLPWQMSEAEKKLTAKDIDELLNKYVSILTDEKITPEELGVENGG